MYYIKKWFCNKLFWMLYLRHMWRQLGRNAIESTIFCSWYATDCIFNDVAFTQLAVLPLKHGLSTCWKIPNGRSPYMYKQNLQRWTQLSATMNLLIPKLHQYFYDIHNVRLRNFITNWGMASTWSFECLSTIGCLYWALTHAIILYNGCCCFSNYFTGFTHDTCDFKLGMQFLHFDM